MAGLGGNINIGYHGSPFYQDILGQGFKGGTGQSSQIFGRSLPSWGGSGGTYTTGNPGAANIYRKIGPKYGILVFLLDCLKGIIVTFPIHFLPTFDLLLLAIMLCALCGHYFPIPFNKIGGTGMGLGIGLVFGIFPLAAFLSSFPAFITLLLLKKPSIAGTIGVISCLIIIWFYFYDLMNIIAIIVCWICIGIKAWIQYKGDVF